MHFAVSIMVSYFKNSRAFGGDINIFTSLHSVEASILLTSVRTCKYIWNYYLNGRYFE